MNDIKERIEKFLKSDERRIKIIVTVGIIGVILLVVSSAAQNKTPDKKSESIADIDYTSYCSKLEEELKEVISSIDGVGKCEIMITLENSSENVYATDNEIRSDSASSSSRDEYVLIDSNGVQQPVLIKEYYPKVQGVSVVCSGGDNSKVKAEITDTVTSLFNISANRVSVSKLK